MKIVIKIGGRQINQLDDIIDGKPLFQPKSDKKKKAEIELIEDAEIDE